MLAFQSTHPRGVRLVRLEEARAKAMFQSTHPRGVRLVSGEAITPVVAVSIHAPAWGATLQASST